MSSIVVCATTTDTLRSEKQGCFVSFAKLLNRRVTVLQIQDKSMYISDKTDFYCCRHVNFVV